MKFLLLMKLRSSVLLIYLFLTSICQLSAQHKNSTAEITVDFDRNGKRDSLVLVILNTLFINLGDEHHLVIYPKLMPDGKLLFTINSEEAYGYFTLARILPENEKNQYDMLGVASNYFWEKGDNLSISIRYPDPAVDLPELVFSGNGAIKYTARNELFNSGIMMSPTAIPRESTFIFPGHQDSIKWMNFTDKYSSILSKRCFDVLKADFLFRSNWSRGAGILSNNVKNTEKRKVLANIYDNLLGLYTKSNLDKNALTISRNYARNYVNDLIAQDLLRNGKKDPTKVYNIIAQQPYQVLRDRLLATFFFANKYDDNTPIQYYTVMNKIKDAKSKAALLEIAPRFSGNKLDEYTFFDEDKNKVSINDYNGKIILVDLWFNGCSGCASFYTNTLSKIESEFKGRKDFVVISINFDKKAELWKKGIESGDYTSKEDAVNLWAGEVSMNHKLVYDFALPGMPFVFLINKSGGIEAFNTTTLYNPRTLSQKIRELL